jgi:L-asparagine transporter-like permease
MEIRFPTGCLKTFLILNQPKNIFMIQRVQSVYLLLVTGLLGLFLLIPYAELTLSENQSLAFNSMSIKKISGNEDTEKYKSTLPLFALVLITSFCSFLSIFLYSRRAMQIRICLLNGVLLVLSLILMYIYYSSTKSSFETIHHAFKIPAIFPFLGIILTFLAYRAIRHDEELVNSYNRLR